ncbi:MAG: mandelate racemase/muconate lactonizing enzyme family protein [Candidatus Korobacteraceae bacterium]|jgi:L-alanine-DL-glutamate epimerase-like enolase superfamily enzyme
MKISRVHTQIVNVPEAQSLAGLPLQPPVVRPFVTLRLETDEGIDGIAVSFAFFSSAMINALKSAVHDLASLAIGGDPLVPGPILEKLRAAAGGSGPGGIFMLAFSAIDIALWDIRGKALNQPLWKLLGGVRQRVPAYASGVLQRNLSDAEVVQAARCLVERGFRQIKMQLGLPGEHSPAKEVERARIVRETVGPDIKLMADVNQLWRVEQAIDVGRRVEKLQLFWLEDVTVHDDFAGLARISETLVTPVAGGEYVWGIVPFRHMLEARSVDILIIDALRVGGITQWMKVAGMAEAFNTRVLNHCFPEFLVHVVAAAPNAFTLEYMPWTLPLFEEVPQLQNGEVIVPDRPGLGLKFDEKFIKLHGA